jgi:hypothetical protein
VKAKYVFGELPEPQTAFADIILYDDVVHTGKTLRQLAEPLLTKASESIAWSVKSGATMSALFTNLICELLLCTDRVSYDFRWYRFHSLNTSVRPSAIKASCLPKLRNAATIPS